MVKINKLKEVLNSISKLRKKNQTEERAELISHLNRLLEYIELNFSEYLANLDDLKFILKYNKDIKINSKTQKQIDEALQTKSKIINEFETIYRNFKNMAKNMPEHMPMKEILANMRKSFDFTTENSSTYNSYYDSTTMTIRKL